MSECAKTLLGQFRSLDCIGKMVRALALVNCGKGFQDIGKIDDGFSDTCAAVLQERGWHVRTVMGTRNMPNHNIPVEVEMVFVLSEAYRTREKRDQHGEI